MKIRRLRAAALWLGLIGLGMMGLTAASASPDIVAAVADRRGEEQTFLTFPEWFLVFSPAEYASFVRDHAPDEFCFWGHIGQFWRGYASVIHETEIRHEPTNWGYHVMIVVIGVSTSVEYMIRSAYETLIGRVTAAWSRARTPEDDYAATVAQEYVDFIRIRPWYEFDFVSRLRRLWTRTDFVGPHMLRKWERKYALTTEYVVKAAYGWVIDKATRTAYDVPLESTSVVVDGSPRCDLPQGAAPRSVQADGTTQLMLPRYEAFMAAALSLARCGVKFHEIAGNRTVILVSAIGPVNATAPRNTSVMMRQAIITRPGLERLVFVVPIAELTPVLTALSPDGLALEHVFDF